MKIIKPVNELTTYVAFPELDMVNDHQKRYYAVPKDYRMSENPQESDPGSAWLPSDIDNEDARNYHQAMQLMSNMYWKILADDAEATYKMHGGSSS